jgi:hypothetical protein
MSADFGEMALNADEAPPPWGRSQGWSHYRKKRKPANHPYMNKSFI